jgi:hypothetical protein
MACRIDRMVRGHYMRGGGVAVVDALSLAALADY